MVTRPAVGEGEITTATGPWAAWGAEMMTVERDNRSVADLVEGARNHEQQAWDALIERYAPLVWSICRRNRLDQTEASDISQEVWVRLVEQLDKLRDPAALPGWLATTTQRECYRFVRAARRTHALERTAEAEEIPDPTVIVEQELLADELHTALHQAFKELPPSYQELLALLIQDPPLSYAEISARLGIPIGTIGPTRQRCLEKLRRCPAIAALINPEGASENAQ
jgi:RNA polymerase sigma factor (sigma-70 family)